MEKKRDTFLEYSPGKKKSLELMGSKHHIKSIAVLLSVINQCTRACEMKDGWRVQDSSQREQLCPRQSYDVSFILSVWCLSSLLLSHPPPGLVQSPMEAKMKPSSLSHTAHYTFQ